MPPHFFQSKPAPSDRLRLALRIAATAGMIAAIAAALGHLGAGDAFKRALEDAVPWIPLLFALEGARIAMDLLALRTLVRSAAPAATRVIAWGAWLRMHLLAQAALVLLPVGRAASEGLKIERLSRAVGGPRAIVSVAVLHGTTLFSVGLAALVGAPIAAARGAPLIALGLLLHGVVCIAGFVALRAALARARPSKSIERWLPRETWDGDAVQAAARAFHLLPPAALALKLCNRLFLLAEAAVVLHVLRAHSDLGASIVAAAANSLGGALEFSIAGVGTQEGALAAAAPALGIDVASALAVTSVLRLVALAWCAVGAVALMLPERSQSESPEAASRSNPARAME